MGGWCHVPKTMSPISYVFYITWLVKEYLNGFITVMSAFQDAPSNLNCVFY